ncbi:acyl-CoA dehydrogenase family protein [Pseudomonas kielensis]|uniref:acyl-CoA dehydrogenase family protein n=1 Tax=Pseudomonas kielensis TaxID=2762577 RepID=UPI0038A182BC
MTPQFNFTELDRGDSLESLRQQVRDFISEHGAHWSALQRGESWSGFDADFSAKLGARGWIGMTWPKIYGGHERTAFERYVVLEELLAAGAPVAAHWFADRQTGPLLLKFGTEAQKRTLLPRMARGECFTSIGMSEPNSGSDLAAVETRAVPVEGGWRVNGTKLWTTYAHEAHYMVLFCRTDGARADRQSGTSQLLVDLKTPGIKINPVMDMAGRHHFNEVVFEDVFLAADALIGTQGQGWAQVTSELAFERSGPERYLSSFRVLVELVRSLRGAADDVQALAIGRLASHIVTLRHLSRSVTSMLQKGQDPQLQASIVKDLGAVLEQEIPEIARLLFIHDRAGPRADNRLLEVLSQSVMNAPSYSLRGGTREILRGIISRGLGLR